MSVDLERDIRTTLQGWADEVRPSPGNAVDAMNRSVAPVVVPDRRSRPVLLLLTGVAAAVLLVAVLAWNLAASDLSANLPAGESTTTVVRNGSVAPPLPMVTFPLTGGWSLDRWNLDNAPAHVTSPARSSGFTVRHTDGRAFELVGIALPPDEAPIDPAKISQHPMTVRGTPGSGYSRDARAHAIVWVEAGRLWTAEGTGYDTIEQLVREVDALIYPDRAAWLAWLPADLAAAVEANPGRNLEWTRGEGVRLLAYPAYDPPGTTPTDLPATEPPTVVFTPADSGWTLTQYDLNRNPRPDGPPTVSAIYKAEHRDGRKVQLQIYVPNPEVTRKDEGLKIMEFSWRGTTALGATVNGTSALLWTEAGRQWEAEGTPYTSHQELSMVLDEFRIVTPATWRAWLPDGMAQALDANPERPVSWTSAGVKVGGAPTTAGTRWDGQGPNGGPMPNSGRAAPEVPVDR